MSDIVTLNGYKIKDEKAVRSYETVALMKADTKLKEGYHVKTKGYYEANDGGHGEYVIVDDDTLVDDGGSIHVLTNGLRAKLIVNDVVNVKQFGAYGDDTHDDTNIIKEAINKYTSVFIPKGVYKITEYISVSEKCHIYGVNPLDSELKAYDCDLFKIDQRYITIENVYLSSTSQTTKAISRLDNTANFYMLKINNVIFYNFEYGIEFANAWDVCVTNSRFNSCKTALNSLGDVGGSMLFTLINVHFNHCTTILNGHGLHIANFIGCNFGIISKNSILHTSGCCITYESCNFETDEYIESNSNVQLIYCYSGIAKFNNCKFKVKGDSHVYIMGVANTFKNLIITNSEIDLFGTVNNMTNQCLFNPSTTNITKPASIQIDQNLYNFIDTSNLGSANIPAIYVIGGIINCISGNVDTTKLKTGTLVYDTVTKKIYYWNNTNLIEMANES